MSLRPSSNPFTISREAMARVVVPARPQLEPAGVQRPIEIRPVGRGLLHLVDAASGEILGVGTDAAVLGRTRDFFQ